MWTSEKKVFYRLSDIPLSFFDEEIKWENLIGKRNKDILDFYFLDKKTCAEISKLINLTPCRINQIIVDCCNKGAKTILHTRSPTLDHRIKAFTEIERLPASSRTKNCLSSIDIKTVDQLLNKSSQEILNLRNFGKKTLKDLHKLVESFPNYHGSIFHKTLNVPQYKNIALMEAIIIKKRSEIIKLQKQIKDLEDVIKIYKGE